MQHVLGLDHVVILVRDLDDAEGRLERLGFRPTPRGVHSPHMGTANTTVMLRNGTYFETLGVLEATPENADSRAVLAEREGLFALVLKTDDAHGASEAFEAAGVAAGSALAFVRPVAFPSGTQDACFTVARVRPAATPGASLFVCQHHTPEIVWREDYLEQPNGATELAEVIGIADDLMAIEDAYGVIFGERCRRTTDQVTIAAGDASVTFLAPSAFVKRFGAVGGPVSSPRPRLAALRVRVHDLDKARATLERNHVPCSEGSGRSVLVAPDQVCGTLLELAP
jgi:catechol 2,3-dioxygenase-like lactoylglutathione lyase family enzyme